MVRKLVPPSLYCSLGAFNTFKSDARFKSCLQRVDHERNGDRAGEGVTMVNDLPVPCRPLGSIFILKQLQPGSRAYDCEPSVLFYLVDPLVPSVYDDLLLFHVSSIRSFAGCII
ncbi:hypothetical protein OUZ56_005305 [Daphnia magna]|uniref:Uncharacterized protein n=1 Tax=Daphnia magna TaxID=35525 RepID=A0ABQ9YSF4_9CRUS|nr:hypothetical protein OUZ56_005305 [Daphnia magna]